MKKLFNKNKINKGFTLIETLVAITILMISIVGPLTIAQKSFMAAITARDQVIASFLAQDMMEQLKNSRDNALLASPPTSFTNWVIGKLSSSAVCPNTDGTSCAVYFQDNGTYGTDKKINPSKFTRWAYYTLNIAGNPSSTPNADHEVKVTVIVKWKEGTVDNFVKLEDNFYDVTL